MIYVFLYQNLNINFPADTRPFNQIYVFLYQNLNASILPISLLALKNLCISILEFK